MLTNHYINNISVKDRYSHDGERKIIVQILYSGKWYEVTGKVANSLMSEAQLGFLLHHRMSLCIETTVGHEKVMGISLSA